MSELVEFKGAGFLSDVTAWYVSAGYRYGDFTPYVSYGSHKGHIKNEPGIDTTGAAPLAAGAAGLNAGINSTMAAFTPARQTTTTLGLRWEAMKNIAVKAQYDSISTGDNSAGRLKTFTGLTPATRVNLVSLAVDFVF